MRYVTCGLRWYRLLSMREGDTVFCVNQSGMVGDNIVKGILTHNGTKLGYAYSDSHGYPCYLVRMPSSDEDKDVTMFNPRLFRIEDVFTTHDEATKHYFIKALAGDRMIKHAH